jgi:hypothetical protein
MTTKRKSLWRHSLTFILTSVLTLGILASDARAQNDKPNIVLVFPSVAETVQYRSQRACTA